MTASTADAPVVPDWVRNMYAKVDSGAVDEYIGLFADTAVLQFGSSDPVLGREAIGARLKAADSGHALEHTCRNCWQADDTTILEFDVAYHYDNGTSSHFPAVTLLQRADGLITSMRVYANPAPAA